MVVEVVERSDRQPEAVELRKLVGLVFLPAAEF
jgi:hypothetical protein